jgi:hypothetical protein
MLACVLAQGHLERGLSVRWTCCAGSTQRPCNIGLVVVIRPGFCSSGTDGCVFVSGFGIRARCLEIRGSGRSVLGTDGLVSDWRGDLCLRVKSVLIRFLYTGLRRGGGAVGGARGRGTCVVAEASALTLPLSLARTILPIRTNSTGTRTCSLFGASR